MCRDIADFLPLLDIAELAPAEEEQVRNHLQTCVRCRAEAARVRRVPYLLGQPATEGWAANVWPTLQLQLAARAKQLHVAGAMPLRTSTALRQRPALRVLAGALLAGAAALLVMVWAGSPFAASPARPVAGLAPAEAPLLAVDTVLTQTVAGYTFTLQPVSHDSVSGLVHADANEVALDYLVTDPQGQSIPPRSLDWSGVSAPAGPRLVDDTGTLLPWLGAASHTGQDTPGGPPVYDYVLAFDANPLSQLTTQRIFTLQVSLPLALVASKSTPAAKAESTGPVLLGPFIFRFRLPFDTARAVFTGPQTVTAQGIPLTCDTLIVTPREARVQLRFAAPDGGAVTAWQPQVTLSHSNLKDPLGLTALGGLLNDRAAFQGWLPAGRWAGSQLSYSDLLKEPDPWIVTVQSLTKRGAGTTETVTGPWIFSLTLQPRTDGGR